MSRYIIPNTKEKYELVELKNGRWEVWSVRTSKILKDCHGCNSKGDLREYNIIFFDEYLEEDKKRMYLKDLKEITGIKEKKEELKKAQ